MKNLNNKLKAVIGWLLLFTGIIIIGYGLFFTYQIFQGLEPAPQIFTSQIKDEVDLPQVKAEGNIEEALIRVFQNILPLDDIPTFLNILVFSIFIFIVFSGGFKISILGIKLLSNEKK